MTPEDFGWIHIGIALLVDKNEDHHLVQILMIPRFWVRQKKHRLLLLLNKHSRILLSHVVATVVDRPVEMIHIIP